MLADLMAVLGGCLVVAGVGLVSTAAALVVAGILLVVLAGRLS